MSRVVSYSVMDTRGVDQGVVNYGGGRAVSRVVSYSVLDTRGVDQGVVNYGGGMLCPGLFRTA